MITSTSNFTSSTSLTSSPISCQTTPSQQIVKGRRYAWTIDSSTSYTDTSHVAASSKTKLINHHPAPAPVLAPSSPKIQVFKIQVLLHKIAEYAPNPELLGVNHEFNKNVSHAIAQIIYQFFFVKAGLRETAPRSPEGQPDYVSMSTQLPWYYQKMKEVHQQRLFLIKREDYTPKMLNQTIPLWIFPSSLEDLPQFYIEWSNADFTKRKEEFDTYSQRPMNMNLDAFQKIAFFLSAPLYDDLRTEISELFTHPKIIPHLSEKDPTFLNCLLRYIVDQIYYTANQKLVYHEGFYAILNLLLGFDDKLSYEVLHYALLIHVEVVALQASIDPIKLNLIGSILSKIDKKLSEIDKKIKQRDLKRLLYRLLSDGMFLLRTARRQKLDSRFDPLLWESQSFISTKEMLGVIQAHFDSFTGCCVIS